MKIWSTLPLAAGLLVVGIFGVARADVSINGSTAPETDPRRAQSGAPITAETNPGGDPTSSQDPQRVAESYRAKGVKLGTFLLMPKLETEESYVSNVYATRTNAKSDFLTVARPELSLRSRYENYDVNVHFLAEQYHYLSLSSEDRLDVSGDISGRYEFSRGSEVNGSAQLFSRHEDRTSPDDRDGLKPTPTQGFASRLGGKHEMGPFTVLAEFSPQYLTFDSVPTNNGTVIPNQDRNRWEVEGKVRGSYELFPGYAAVTQFTANTRQYDRLYDRNGFQRSSDGYRAEGGVGFDLTQLLRGDFLVGYLQQNYQDPRFKDPQGLSFRASLNWTPDKLTVIVPGLERAVRETTMNNVSSVVSNSASLLIRHEVARNFVLSAYGQIAYDEYAGSSLSDWAYEGRLKATYAFAPEFYIGGEAVYRSKDSTSYFSSYEQTIFTVRLGLQL